MDVGWDNSMSIDQPHERQRLCGAKTRAGTPCRGFAMPNGRCRNHGGLTPSGIASPHFRHGRYSKDFPARLAARYEDAITDPDLLRLDAEIHLVDVLIRERLAALDTAESGAIWRDLGAAWKDFGRARGTGDTAKMMTSLNLVETLISRGADDWSARQEILDMLDRRRKLVEAETRRRIQMNLMVTAEQASLLVSSMAAIVMDHVPDLDVRAAIARDLRKLMDAEGSIVYGN